MSNLTITGGKITGDNGGGIFSLSDLTVLNSTFTGNQAVGGEGGAIDSEGGTLRIINRSEEHTSELQSHSDLVCRLLLEKKKKTKIKKQIKYETHKLQHNIKDLIH